MIQILNITLPIYLIIGLGFASVKHKLMLSEQMPVFGRYLVNVALPALILQTLSSKHLDEVFNANYLWVYGLASIGSFGIGTALAVWKEGCKIERVALQAMGFSASNSAFVGLPVVSQMIGPKAAVAMALCMLIENMLIIPLTLLMLGVGRGTSRIQAVKSSFETLFKNPIFIAIVLGFISSWLDFEPPNSIQSALRLLAGSAGPVALFLIGGMLVGQQLTSELHRMSGLIMGKLFLHPILVLLFLSVFDAFDPELQLAAILFACMPLPSMYPALAQKYGLGGFCASALVLSTVLSFFTLNLWLAVAPHLVASIHKGVWP